MTMYSDKLCFEHAKMYKNKKKSVLYVFRQKCLFVFEYIHNGHNFLYFSDSCEFNYFKVSEYIVIMRS